MVINLIADRNYENRRKLLNKKCVSYIKKGDTKGTRANHRTHHKSYLQFCQTYRYEPYPATEWRYCQYAVYLHEQDKVPETIQNYVGTIRVLHKMQNLYAPTATQIHYKKLVEYFKKQCTKPVKQAQAMTHDILRQIFPHVKFQVELEAVSWVSMLVAFNLVLRVSNIGPPTRGSFSAEHNLIRGDLMLKQGHLTLKVRWAKNLQHRNQILYCPLIPSEDRRLCPITWVRKMVKIVPAGENEPFFLVRQGNQRHPLTSKQVGRIMKEWCKRSGLDPGSLTPHALRRGGLTWGHRAKLSGETLQILGGWASEAYKRYIEYDFESRVQSAKIMAEMNL